MWWDALFNAGFNLESYHCTSMPSSSLVLVVGYVLVMGVAPVVWKNRPPELNPGWHPYFPGFWSSHLASSSFVASPQELDNHTVVPSLLANHPGVASGSAAASRPFPIGQGHTAGDIFPYHEQDKGWSGVNRPGHDTASSFLASTVRHATENFIPDTVVIGSEESNTSFDCASHA